VVLGKVADLEVVVLLLICRECFRRADLALLAKEMPEDLGMSD